ncbi:MAG TPA: Rv3654c family TadE-like protein [Acidimicrobiia bacterium]|nr:Rv3654c family TadE-like protein [Acidimicrobiia bacterium]
MREKGGGSVLAVAAIAAIMVVTLAVVAATQIVTARARAVAAADAAALAAAVNTFPPAADRPSPRLAAFEIAVANGAALVGCHCPVDGNLRARSVQVDVEVALEVLMLGPMRIGASSRAEYIP